ncbi:MAG: hypothetical protein ACD_79C00352G0004 [uncultured bacterium]|nr:MAG: hypothetical protein ACD_79C00352G0004 [uncultured bacterium]
MANPDENVIREATSSNSLTVSKTEKKEYKQSSANSRTENTPPPQKNDIIEVTSNSFQTSYNTAINNSQQIDSVEKASVSSEDKVKKDNKSENEEIKAEAKVKQSGSFMHFRIVENRDEKTGEISRELVVYLLDKETGDVIRRVPPEQFKNPKNEDFKGEFVGVFVDKII